MMCRSLYRVLLVGMISVGALVPSIGFGADGILPVAAEKREMEEAKGKIVEINLDAKTIRLEPGVFSSEKDLIVNDQTKIVVNGKPGTIAELRKGDRVKVHYAEVEDRKTKARMAEYIEVLG